ncbi:hypothetical protein C2G38_2209558 [Gigaspora rosea]|uniref:Uncharacterized protein n=1 Tax=Gigaspora rosea TaxID=44941 RepID=A0A397UIX0_9GLOM|nr:hypothetical protein C2G38_2209548 [Gigaspora rosea]RIB09182.1 hypothetical protein C2G38_2209558 [Gigaspora rosea]
MRVIKWGIAQNPDLPSDSKEAHTAEIASWIDKELILILWRIILMNLICFFVEVEMVLQQIHFGIYAIRKNLVIVKVKRTDEILGGYNPVG